MNPEITTLHVKECPHGNNRMFCVFFPPDPTKENFEVGMKFTVVSVNRSTGEIWFSLDLECMDDQLIKRPHSNDATHV